MLELLIIPGALVLIWALVATAMYNQSQKNYEWACNTRDRYFDRWKQEQKKLEALRTNLKRLMYVGDAGKYNITWRPRHLVDKSIEDMINEQRDDQ